MIREDGGELKVSSQTRFAQHICFETEMRQKIKKKFSISLRKMMDKNI